MYSYFTELDIEECKKRIDYGISDNFLQVDRLRGNMNYQENKFYLAKRQSNYSNSFSRIFYGKLTKKENGTLIEGNFRRHIIIRIFIFVWFGGISFQTGIMFLSWLAKVFLGTAHGNEVNVTEVLLPLGMLVFGFLLVKSGVWFSKGQENYILEFLKTELKAK